VSEQPPSGTPGPSQQQPWTPPPPPPYGQPQYGQPQYGQPGYGYQPPPPTSSRATTALVLGLCGFFVCPLVLSIPAWIVGRGAMREIDASNGQLGGRGQAQAGYILGIVGTVLSILAIIAVIVIFAIGFSMSCESTSTDSSWSFNCS
jgi:hypothetical protein